MPARVRPGTGNATWVLMLAMALWLASTLGFMHRVVHAPGARALVATVAVAGVIATDPAATGPVWGCGLAIPCPAELRDALLAAARGSLG